MKRKENKNFWNDLKLPALVLAPMADVTDAAFRQMFAKYGKPDVTWTEFVSADGLFLATENEMDDEIYLPAEMKMIAKEHGVAPNQPLLKDLMFTEAERPIVAQFFSREPEHMQKAARLAEALGFDGVDINMGCPACVIVKQGAGCAMIQEPEAAREIIHETKNATNLPVTVKTRIGYSRDEELKDWLSALLTENPEVVTLHARTKKDMSKVPARWETISKAVQIRDKVNPNVLIFGNGDVDDLDEATTRARETGCDGIMVGRGIFGNPYFFNKDIDIYELPIERRLQILVEHVRLFDRLLGDTKSFATMRKHFKAYISGFDGAKDFRVKLMKTDGVEEVEREIDAFLRKQTVFV